MFRRYISTWWITVLPVEMMSIQVFIQLIAPGGKKHAHSRRSSHLTLSKQHLKLLCPQPPAGVCAPALKWFWGKKLPLKCTLSPATPVSLDPEGVGLLPTPSLDWCLICGKGATAGLNGYTASSPRTIYSDRNFSKMPTARNNFLLMVYDKCRRGLKKYSNAFCFVNCFEEHSYQTEGKIKYPLANEVQ